MTDETTYTPDQIASMRQTVQAFDAEQAAVAQAAEDQRLQAVREFTHSEAYTTLLSAIDALCAQYATDETLQVHLHCLEVGLPNLMAAAGPLPVSQ